MTWMIQVHVPERVWKFESSLRHHYYQGFQMARSFKSFKISVKRLCPLQRIVRMKFSAMKY